MELQQDKINIDLFGLLEMDNSCTNTSLTNQIWEVRQREEIEKLVNEKYPIYLKDDPKNGIKKDCRSSISMKMAAREDYRKKLMNGQENIK